MLIGSGLQALATSDKFKPLVLGQIRAAGNTTSVSMDVAAGHQVVKKARSPSAI
jgi:hypothetical protein